MEGKEENEGNESIEIEMGLKSEIKKEHFRRTTHTLRDFLFDTDIIHDRINCRDQQLSLGE